MGDVLDINELRLKKDADVALSAMENIMFTLADYIKQKVRLMYFTIAMDSLDTAVLYDNNMDEIDLKFMTYCMKHIALSMDKYIDKLSTKEFIIKMDALIMEMVLPKMNDIENILECDEIK